jgi:hypothetical protein
MGTRAAVQLLVGTGECASTAHYHLWAVQSH